MRHARTGLRYLAVLLALVLLAGACSDSDTSSDDGGGDGSTTTAAASTSTSSGDEADRPDGPVADITELTGGEGVFLGTPDAIGEDTYVVEFDEPGYVQEEYLASGTATSYAPVGELTSDGQWTLEEDETADYATRVLVRRPEDPADFSGVVVVEWMNVSGGVDANPGWSSVGDEILREGHAWVGVSAQLIGVEGGPVRVQVDVPGSEYAGLGLKTIDPERYGSLQHPGDAFSYDIYTQVVRALRDGEGLGGLEPTEIIASGQSQSAFALVTYINGVQPLTQAFDGFFVHSRGGAWLPLAPEASAGIEDAVAGPTTIIRTDTDVPVVDVQSENDVAGVLGSLAARQPDSDVFRLWEIAGTAHADTSLTGEQTEDYIDCGLPINHGPMHVVAKAAMHHLVAWIIEGEPPPEAPRLDVTEGDAPVQERDEDGIAVGGIRTPPVDVPVYVLSGEKGPGEDIICILAGSTAPMDPERIAELYSSREDYEEQYAAAVDEAIEAGFVLEADRETIEAYADPELVSG